jgi:hypothetical protein
VLSLRNNPGGGQGRLVNGFTFTAATATLTIPDSSADYLATVEIPVRVTGVEGLVSADLFLVYDSTVLSLQSVRLGALVSSFALAYNDSTPGLLWASLAGSAPVSGDGDLLVLTFDVIGDPRTTANLHWKACGSTMGSSRRCWTPEYSRSTARR